MHCNHVSLGNGLAAIVCTRGKRPIRCAVCGSPGDRLCDFPVTVKGKRKTCDKPLCTKCSTKQGAGIDFCPAHAQIVAGGLKL